MITFRNNEKNITKLREINGELWQNEFKTELEIGETYHHSKYGEVTILRVFIEPQLECGSWFFFWKKVWTSYDVNVVFSYKPEGSLGAVTVRKMDELFKGLTVQLKFDNEVKKRVSALSKE